MNLRFLRQPKPSKREEEVYLKKKEKARKFYAATIDQKVVKVGTDVT